MAVFRHALQICTIAYISIATQGHVLLAVNVEDFGNLAKQFLSKNLAKKLTQLVSESAGANRRDDMNISGLDLKKVAEIIRTRLLNEDKAPPVSSAEKFTRNNKIKRFNTVTNTVDTTERPTVTEPILRNPNYEDTSPGLIYIKDDIDKLLQTINDEKPNNDRKQSGYSEIRLNESDEKILSQERTKSKGLSDGIKEKHKANQNETHKKIDYTETKLGDWLYNHIISQKPTKIKNQKIGYIDINDGSAEEMPDESENIRNIQYVYETPNDTSLQYGQNVPALGPKNKHTDDVKIKDQIKAEHSTINEYIMGPKLNTNYQKLIEDNYPIHTKDQEIENYQVNEYVEPIQDILNTYQENIALDQDKGRMLANFEETKPEYSYAKMESSRYDVAEGNHQSIEDHVTYNKYILGSKDKENQMEEPQRQPVGENYMHENYTLGQQTKSNNNKVDPRQPGDSEKIFNSENMASNKDEADRSSYRDQILSRNIQRDSDTKTSKNHHYLSDYKEDKSDSFKWNTESSLEDTIQAKRPQKEKYTTPTKENYIQSKKPQKQPIEENDMYEKYALGSETKNTKLSKDKPLVGNDYVFQQPIPDNTHRFDQDISNMEDDEFSYKDKSILRNTKRDSSAKITKNGVFTTDVPKKNEKFVEDSLPHFQAVKLGSSSSDEMKNKQVEDTSSKHNFGKYTSQKINKKQPMEENDMYEKYSLGSKETIFGKQNKGDYRVRDKDEENDNYDKYSLVSKVKDDKNKEDKTDDTKYEYEETVLGKKHKGDHRDRDRNEENVMYEKYSRGSKDKDSKGRKLKKDDDKSGYGKTVLGKKDKENHRVHDKDERNDKYDKYTIGSKEKKNRDKKIEKQENDNYNHKETVLGNKHKGDHRIQYKDEENDMYNKYSSGSKSKDREVEKENNHYGYKEKVLGKKYQGDHRIGDQDEENDMYDKYSLGAKGKNSKDREVKKGDDKYGYKETVMGKKRKGDRGRGKDKENDMYDKYSLGSKQHSRDTEVKNDDDKYGYKETVLGKKRKGDHQHRDNDEDNHTYDNYSPGSKNKNSRDREVEKDDDKYGYKENVLGKKHKADHRDRDKDEENDMYDKYSLGAKGKNSKDREVKKGDDKYGYKETILGKKRKNDRGRDKDKENNMYDKYSQGSKNKQNRDTEDKNDDDKYGYKETVLEKKRKGDHRDRDNDEENHTYDKYSQGSKHKNSRDREVEKDDDKYGYKETVLEKKHKTDHRGRDKDEENDMYDKYSLGSKDRNSKDRKVKKDDDNYGYEETVLGKKHKGNPGRDKDSDNNDELLLKNKNRHILKVKDSENNAPSAGYADDPRSDFQEVKPESIKAKTESLLDSVEGKGKNTKHFKMKGTVIPKREFYKLSSPNYYKDLPRTVDKYDFDEPLPQRDRERDKVAYLKREPARVNRKLKLPMYEKVS